MLFAERYKIVEQIGRGGMGVVYKAEDILLNTTVALKTIEKGLINANHVVRFQSEARALAALNHPNVVPVYTFDITQDGCPYIVMRLEQGQPLSNFIDERNSLDLHTCLRFFIQICEAMEHAHQNGILHRDLKPGNVLVNFDGSKSPRIVVIDFGLAMMESGKAIDSLTKSGLIMGSPAYMSPEQINGTKLDARSDIYSLGCVMFEMLTGESPYVAESTLQLLQKKTCQAAASVNDVKPGFSKELENIVSRTLELSPSDRFQSMHELRQALLSLDLNSESTHSENQHPHVASRYHQVWRSASVSVLLVAVIAALVFSGAAKSNFKMPEKNGNEINNRPLSARTVEFNWTRFDNHAVNDLTYSSSSDRGFRFQPDKVWGQDGILQLSHVDDKKAQHQMKSYPMEKPASWVSIKRASITGLCFADCPLPIQRVTLANIDTINIPGWRALSRLPRLTRLELDAVRLQPESVEQISRNKSLRAIVIKNCLLNGDCFDHLVRSNVEILLLDRVVTTNRLLSDNHPLDDKDFQSLTADCRNLRTFRWYGMPLSSGALATVARLPKLNVLELRDLGLTDDHLEKLRFDHLEQLVLSGNNSYTYDGLKALLDNNRVNVDLDGSAKSISQRELEKLTQQAEAKGMDLNVRLSR
ncbi:MAG: serine/threonine protein kinase [Candidatus Obscuribacterales bacterium]|nr:serine/threonine protein kinase [Candidatus Obscuribacterales bacterium]